MRVSFFIPPVFLLIMLLGSFPAWSTADGPDTPCRLEAYLVDTDPQGTNARAKPDIRSKIVKKLTYKKDGGIILSVSRFNNGWLFVERGIDGGNNEIQVNAWVSAGLTATGIRASDEYADRAAVPLFSRPDKSSRVITMVPLVDGEGGEFRLLACQGEWALVECRESKTGCWLEPIAQCPNPFTTCP